MKLPYIHREQEIKYLSRAIKRGLVLITGPRGIGKSTIIKKLYEKRVIKNIYDFKKLLFTFSSSTYNDILELALNEANNRVALDSIDILPKEYRYGKQIFNILLTMEANGGIISSNRLDLQNYLYKMGIKYESYDMREISLLDVYNMLIRVYPDSDIYIIKLIAELTEGYPSAIKYFVNAAQPEELISRVDGVLSLNLDLFLDYDYIFHIYPELKGVKRETEVFQILNIVSRGCRAKDIYKIGLNIPVYLSRLQNLGIISKITSGKTSFYYIRDPILRLHIISSNIKDKYLSIDEVRRYIGPHFITRLLFYHSQGKRVTDSLGTQFTIPKLNYIFDFQDNYQILYGDRKIGIFVGWDAKDINIENFLSLPCDIRVALLLEKIDLKFMRKLAYRDIYILDREGINMMLSNTGFLRNI